MFRWYLISQTPDIFRIKHKEPKQNIFRWYLISQTPDIFQNKPKEHNKQLYITNQIGKVGTTTPKTYPKKTNKNIKKTHRNIRVLPAKMRRASLELTFWTCDTHDGCIFTRKKPRTKPKQRIIWWQFDSPISEKTTLPRKNLCHSSAGILSRR